MCDSIYAKSNIIFFSFSLSKNSINLLPHKQINHQKKRITKDKKELLPSFLIIFLTAFAYLPCNSAIKLGFFLHEIM